MNHVTTCYQNEVRKYSSLTVQMRVTYMPLGSGRGVRLYLRKRRKCPMTYVHQSERPKWISSCIMGPGGSKNVDVSSPYDDGWPPVPSQAHIPVSHEAKCND